jgi:hypothetical protein
MRCEAEISKAVSVHVTQATCDGCVTDLIDSEPVATSQVFDAQRGRKTAGVPEDNVCVSGRVDSWTSDDEIFEAVAINVADSTDGLAHFCTGLDGIDAKSRRIRTAAGVERAKVDGVRRRKQCPLFERLNLCAASIPTGICKATPPHHARPRTTLDRIASQNAQPVIKPHLSQPRLSKNLKRYELLILDLAT